MNTDVVFVLLADLHFGAGPQREAELPPLAFAGLLRRLGIRGDAERFFASRCGAHNLAVLKALPRYLTKLLVRLREKEEYPAYAFDLTLILGDLATWPSADSYEFIRHYLTQDVVRLTSNRTMSGLALKMENIIAIPGNHDKLLQRDLEIYKHFFLDHLQIGCGIEERGSKVIHRKFANREFIFVLVDANVYAQSKLTLNFRARDHLACGETGDKLNVELTNKLHSLRNGETVDGVVVESYSKALKILVLHYAVDIDAVLLGAVDPNQLVIPHVCHGIEQTVSALANEIDLVIHGHLHAPRLYNVAGVPVISVGTTSQKGSATPAFYLLKVAKSGQIHAEHHVWRGHGFSRDQSPDLNRPMN